MRGQKPHRLARGGAHGGKAEALDQAFQDRVRGLAGMDDAGGDAERPGRGRNESALDLTWWDDQSPVASLSSISRSAVAASGTRSSASASTMSASPSLVESE